MKCRSAYRWFDDYCRNGPRAIPTAVARHIERCPQCQKRVHQWITLVHNLQSFPLPAASPELKRRLLCEASAFESLRIRSVAWKSVPRTQAVLGWWSIALAAGMVICAALWWFVQRQRQPLSVSFQPRARTWVIEFSIQDASSVAVVGDFNGWNTASHLLQKAEEGRWTLTLHLEAGVYEYLLLIDGKEWVLDPNNPVRVPDGFGGFNSALML